MPQLVVLRREAEYRGDRIDLTLRHHYSPEDAKSPPELLRIADHPNLLDQTILQAEEGSTRVLDMGIWSARCLRGHRGVCAAPGYARPQAAKDSRARGRSGGSLPCSALPASTQTGRWSEAEDQGKGTVYRSELIGIETPGGPPESLWIHHRSLLNEDSGLGSVE